MICRIVVVLVALTSIAHSEPPDKPWVVGVSDEEQRTALDIYNEGNVEFQAARFAQALVKYAEALKHWDHPAIHFNMAVCLINLDQPIEAKQHLDKALQYGEAPLGQAMYAQGITHRHALDGQIARVKIACNEPDTTITLDGRFLFKGPGEVERLVLPGPHQIVGTKPGYATASETLQLLPARETRYDVHLLALKAQTKLERLWAPWKPWTVAGFGVATIGVAAIYYAISRGHFDDYDHAITTSCPDGCDATMLATMPAIPKMKDDGYVAQDASIALFAIGGAITVAGIVGLVLDQPHAMLEHPVAIVPTTNGATLSVSGRW